MIFLRKPTSGTIRAYLEAQGRHDLTYRAVGASTASPPSGYVVDHTRIQLGHGGAVFAAARAALERWDQFPRGWVEARPEGAPIRAGQAVAILARSFGLWWLNACRIVAVVNDEGPVSRFGFAYGTLPDHIGTGEERFLVEWDREGDAVWYDILAFSQPRQALARLGYPLMRRKQRRFGRESAAAMRRAVAAST